MGLDNITLTIGTPFIDIEIEFNFTQSDPLEDFKDQCLAEEEDIEFE
ncbi:hypothetical protein [Gottfriedia acidiceleris]